MRVWLQLFRAPNLFTVPGDPALGYLLANGWEIDRGLPLAIAASLSFYAAGLLMNDLADEEEDRRERPNRPLPSGAANRRTVLVVMMALCLIGLAALALTGRSSAMIAGAVLVAAMALYNYLTKHWPVIGALNMGLCRSLSVMLGGLVGFRAEWQLAFIPAIGFGLYIAAVTNLARHETRPRAPWLARILPAAMAILISAAAIPQALAAPDRVPAAAIFALAAGVVVWLAVQMFSSAKPLPPFIGSHIRALLLFQAATCYAAEPTSIGRGAAIILLLLWPVSRWFGRWFYAS